MRSRRSVAARSATARRTELFANPAAITQIPAPAEWPRVSPAHRQASASLRSGLGRHLWVVERAFVWLYGFRQLRARREHRAYLHLSLLQLAGALICPQHLKLSL